MANGAFKFKDNSGNVVSFISGSGSNILFYGGTLDLSGMTGLTIGNRTLSGTTQNAISASHAESYLLTSSFNTYSGTTNTLIGTLQTSTSSLNSFTSSATTRLNSIEGVSGSYATTGSNQFKNNQVITGSLTVTGFIDTQELRTTYISSSILYRSGSTKFGDELTDNHSFSGSLNISGSLNVSGSILTTGSSVGIGGQSNPARTLHVMGQAAFDMTHAGVVIQDTISPISASQIVSYKQTNAVGSAYRNLNLRADVLGIAIMSGSGYVSIGKDTATSMLDVNGNLLVSGSITTTSSANFSGTISTIGEIRSIHGGVDGTFSDAFVGVYSSNNNEQNAIQTSVSSGASLSGFRFQASNGGGSSGRTTVVDFLRDRQIFYTNVGIGTSSPNVKLEVLDTSTSSGEVARFQRNLDQINEYAYIKVGNASYPAYFGAMLSTYDIAYMSMSPNPTDGKALAIRTTDGFVGVGTISPVSKLDVAGNIKNSARVYSGNAVTGNISTNLLGDNGRNYVLVCNLNDVAGFSLNGTMNAASYTCWNLSNFWIIKTYSSTVSYAGITGQYKSGCDMNIVDLNYSGGRYIAIGYTSNPEIDVIWTGYRLLHMLNADGSAIVVPQSSVTLNSTLATY
jgi:hypothetical protein